MKVKLIINVRPNSSRNEIEQMIQDIMNRINGDCYMWGELLKVEIDLQGDPHVD